MPHNHKPFSISHQIKDSYIQFYLEQVNAIEELKRDQYNVHTSHAGSIQPYPLSDNHSKRSFSETKLC